jgi:hypothetical protein
MNPRKIDFAMLGRDNACRISIGKEEQDMAVSGWTEQETAVAKRIWAEYQKLHDLSDCEGQTAGIDPSTGRIWLGDSIPDVVAQRDAAGLDTPLRFERVGSDTYYQKGGRR